ncbi:MAG: histidine phosphatase family protein [Chloroflexi bacterium]|nr:histidine phosphatase family protein [Chloroflexota bacterium]
MARLFLVRHGNTEYNSNRRFAGANSDIELTELGREQVKRLRNRLADETIDFAYSSDLKRALTTAQITVGERNIEIMLCPELREMDYGEAEGLTFDQIKERHPDVADSIRSFSLQLTFPGGECFDRFCERTCTFLDRLEAHDPERSVLVVAHGGPIRTLICRLLDMDLKHWRQLRIDNASLTIINTYPSRNAIVNVLNDTSHLKGVEH